MPPWRLISFALVALLVALQYPLWFGNGGVLAVWKLKQEIASQTEENKRLRERNQALAAEVIDLKQGLAAIEERARIDLGMIKNGETFYQVIDDRPATEVKEKTPSRFAEPQINADVNW